MLLFLLTQKIKFIVNARKGLVKHVAYELLCYLDNIKAEAWAVYLELDVIYSVVALPVPQGMYVFWKPI